METRVNYFGKFGKLVTRSKLPILEGKLHYSLGRDLIGWLEECRDLIGWQEDVGSGLQSLECCD